MRSLLKIIAGAVIALASLGITGSAVADDYPSRAVRLINPYAAGGLTDIVARELAKMLSDRIGQPVFIENRPGAGGIIGVETAAGRPPKSLAELISMAKANPGGLNYGSAGNASTAHLTTELFSDQENIKMFHVAYKGESPAFTEIMAGRVTGMFATLGGAYPLIQAGKLQPIAIATKERSVLLPDVPTFEQAGVKALEVYGWYGVLAPKNTPKNITDLLTRELIAIGHEPEFRNFLSARGMEAIGSTQEELASLIKSETVRWGEIIRKVGIRAE